MSRYRKLKYKNLHLIQDKINVRDIIPERIKKNMNKSSAVLLQA